MDAALVRRTANGGWIAFEMTLVQPEKGAPYTTRSKNGVKATGPTSIESLCTLVESVAARDVALNQGSSH